MKANPELLEIAEAKIAKLAAEQKLMQAITLKAAEQQLVSFLGRLDSDLSDKYNESTRWGSANSSPLSAGH